MLIKDIAAYLESIAPLAFQESYDNAGLIIGDSQVSVQRVLVCLDVTEAVMAEAIEKRCELIVSHHPIIFQPLKKITGKNFVERIILAAIKNNIALYAIHTNLDNVLKNGVNQTFAEKLGLCNIQILNPKPHLLYKLTTFAPVAYTQNVLNALYSAGAGSIGNYKNCSFTVVGEGEFTPTENAHPFVGTLNNAEKVEESRIEIVYPAHLNNAVVRALKQVHPYQTVAYYVQALENNLDEVGSGVTGTVDTVPEIVFLEKLKQLTQATHIKYTGLLNKPITKVAFCGGSGRFLLEIAMQAGADIFISSDFKYHDYFEADGKILIADIGHFESEQHTIALLHRLIAKQFSNLIVNSTNIVTNPVKFL